jgi:hypothetical protein
MKTKRSHYVLISLFFAGVLLTLLWPTGPTGAEQLRHNPSADLPGQAPAPSGERTNSPQPFKNRTKLEGLLTPAAANESFTALTGPQPQTSQYQFVEHEIQQEFACVANSFSFKFVNQSTGVFSFDYLNEGFCPKMAIPDGRIALNFPDFFAPAVPFPASTNSTGTLQVFVDSQDFRIRNKSLFVDTVINRLPKLEQVGFEEDLRRAPCALARQQLNPPLAGGSDSAPGLNPFASLANCSITAPAPFQSYEGDLFTGHPCDGCLFIISTVNLVIATSVIGPADFFQYGGVTERMKFTIISKYRAATCPASSLKTGSFGPNACPANTLRIDTAPEVDAGKDSEVRVEVLKADGTLDTSFNGSVRVSLAQGTTDGIGVLQAGTQSGSTLSLPVQNGRLNQTLVLATPRDPLNGNTVITPQTKLKGKAVVKAELEQVANVSSQKEVEVRSPLDLRIDHIEVQQGVKQGSGGLWAGERDLLVRVFLAANRTTFDKYSRIAGITAKLTVKDKTGNEIVGSPFTISKGRISNVNVPEGDYVFIPNSGPMIDGSDSLNYLLKGTFEQQLSLEAKLDDVIPDRDPGNNSASYGPMNFGISRSVSIVYAPMRVLRPAGPSTEFPSEVGIEQEIEFMKQSWPVASRALRFVRAPDEVRSTNPFTGDPRSQWFGLGFYLSSFQGVRYVYLVDSAYFPVIHRAPGTNGVTNSILKYSIVNADRCANTISECGSLSHEVGHTFSLGDTYVNRDLNGQDDGSASPSSNNPRRPNATDAGNVVEDGNFSWFRHEFATGNNGFLDFMGNDGPAWVDLTTWNFLKSKLLFQSPTSQPQETKLNAAGDYIVVQGRVNKDGTGSFGNCYTLSLTDPENLSTGGAYVIETLDASSTVLSSVTFAPEFRLPHTILELEQTDFSFALPFSSAVRQIRLRSGSGILASRTVSANAPTARFVSDFGGTTLTGVQNVTWTGSDADDWAR